ncbi:hypothetical protein FRC12_005275 [Ceratobasidium sp. 428]|nr:hypothetical protein FRC12_005275 [Ceratobasidium sp. 428]
MKSRNISVSERVFEISELVALICNFASQQDRVRLLQVNQCLFLYAGAFVWRHVPGAIHLLRLIPGMPACASIPPDISDCPTIKINTSRLELYAHFVQSLEVYHPLAKTYCIQNLWQAHRVPDVQQLSEFPKLHRLTYTCLGKLEENQLDYIPLFLSSSLREIEIGAQGGSPLWQNLSSVSNFLSLISHRCPELEGLRIYSGEPLPHTEVNRKFHVAISAEASLAIHQTMDQFRSLRRLTISPAVLEPTVFRSIGAFLNLETLTIQSEAYGGLVYDEYSLDDASFSALRYLELVDLNPHTIMKICNLQPLLRRLEYASVKFGRGSDETWKYDGDRRDSLLALVRCCPRLTGLKFDIGECDNEIIMMAPSLVNLFQSRQLRYINITALGSSTEHTKWTELISALPLVEELHLPMDILDYRTLRDFATMLPRLHLLELRAARFEISKGATGDFERVPSPPQIPLHLKCGFRMLQVRYHMDTIARYLHALWPNVVVEVIKFSPEIPAPYIAAADRRMKRTLSELRHACA